jgi:aryl-alcohol dehydrogenase-like predicted oxidoreductase
MKTTVERGRIKLGAGTVSRLGFGTLRLTEGRGYGPARSNAVQLLRRAVDLGIDLIDTADSYGPETAESVIREALHPYEGLTIATKGGFEHSDEHTWTPNGRPEHLRAAVEGSLKRLGLEQIPLYFLHVPDDKVPYEESLGALDAMHTEGKIRLVGISNVGIEHFRLARTILGERLVAVQNYYNVMFHHGPSAFYPDTEAVLDECELHELAFVAWEPMGTGADFPDIDDTELFRRRALDDIARFSKEHGISQHTARLAAVLSRSEQLVAIPGTSNLAHLEANMDALKLCEDSSAFLGAWLIQRPVRLSHRERAELAKPLLQVEDLSTRTLPPWRTIPDRER